MPHHVTIFGTSLDPASRSHVLARHAYDQLTARGVSAAYIDLRELDLPVCGRSGAFDHPHSVQLRAEVARSTHLLFGVAIYNYDVSASAKNLIELLSSDECLIGKTVGFLCAAGGQRSYMSVIPFANSLMLDFRCWIVPRFVYAVSGDFRDGSIINPEILQRITDLTTEMFVRP